MAGCYVGDWNENENARNLVDVPSDVKKTSVVRIRNERGQCVQDCDVYIGRAVTRGGWDLAHSEWNNPFTVRDWGQLGSLSRYEYHIRYERPDLLSRLPELVGKRLGCWCKPEPCHGDVLVKLVNEFHPDFHPEQN